MDLGEAIVQVVTDVQGCKATELASLLAERFPELVSQFDNVVKTVEQLVKTGALVEIEYVLPNMTYRVKSFLLPKGTNILLNLGQLSSSYEEDSRLGMFR